VGGYFNDAEEKNWEALIKHITVYIRNELFLNNMQTVVE